ncbi:MAG: hypothetical protein R3Y11_08915 [Pseudomonadota bacterium]
MSKEDIIELDTIMELTEPHTDKAQGVPLSLGQDDAVFATLKAPHAKSSVAINTPYADVPSVHDVMPSLGEYDESEAILELDSSSVVHPQYTVTTELFLDPAEQVAPKNQERIPENVHIDTVHADAVHVGEVHINTIHAGKALYDSMTTQQNAYTEKPNQQPEHKPECKPAQEPIDTQAKHDESCDDMQEFAQALETSQQILRDISTLKTTMASMQLRLAAQESCVASLESRLMAAETKNRELEAQCHKLEALCFSQDAAQLEQITATTAARIVREEIQALLESAEQQ